MLLWHGVLITLSHLLYSQGQPLPSLLHFIVISQTQMAPYMLTMSMELACVPHVYLQSVIEPNLLQTSWVLQEAPLAWMQLYTHLCALHPQLCPLIVNTIKHGSDLAYYMSMQFLFPISTRKTISRGASDHLAVEVLPMRYSIYTPWPFWHYFI